MSTSTMKDGTQIFSHSLWEHTGMRDKQKGSIPMHPDSAQATE
jgi:hypothetical protein